MFNQAVLKKKKQALQSNKITHIMQTFNCKLLDDLLIALNRLQFNKIKNIYNIYVI